MSRALHRTATAFALSAALALTGCATTPPLDATGARTGIRPYQVGIDPPSEQTTVLWGGMVIEVVNRERHTEVVVLAYPLDERQRPKVEAPSEGRFIVVLPGFVEPLDYPQGRFVTLRGALEGTRDGRIGDRDYAYPLVRAQAAHLWPRNFRQSGPRISIGIGVGL